MRRISGPSRRVAAKAAVELAEVVVDAEREAHPLDRQLQLGRAGRRGLALAERAAARPAPDRPARPADTTRSRPGCQARTSTGRAADVQQPGGDPAADPQRAIVAAAAAAGRARAAAPRPRAGGSLERRPRPAQRPSRWTSTRKERLATTLPARSRRRERRRGARVFEPTALTARTAATVAAPASTPRRRRSRRCEPRRAGPASRLLVARSGNARTGAASAARVLGVSPRPSSPRRSSSSRPPRSPLRLGERLVGGAAGSRLRRESPQKLRYSARS